MLVTRTGKDLSRISHHPFIHHIPCQLSQESPTDPGVPSAWATSYHRQGQLNANAFLGGQPCVEEKGVVCVFI